VPLDFKTMMASVEKTGRVVIVDECHQSCGVATELSAGIWRVNTLDVPVPYSEPSEEYISPSESRITEAIRSVLDLSSTRGQNDQGTLFLALQ
jgi:pyruvate/2-oxoglutarate/acetoin dehydrogenase E1 component